MLAINDVEEKMFSNRSGVQSQGGRSTLRGTEMIAPVRQEECRGLGAPPAPHSYRGHLQQRWWNQEARWHQLTSRQWQSHFKGQEKKRRNLYLTLLLREMAILIFTWQINYSRLFSACLAASFYDPGSWRIDVWHSNSEFCSWFFNQWEVIYKILFFFIDRKCWSGRSWLSRLTYLYF